YSYLTRLTTISKVKGFVQNKNIDIIYNYAPVIPLKGIPQVVRSVYSNLYFPEVNFWSDYSFVTRIRKRVIDFMRRRGTLAAEGLVFENESMLERAVSMFKYPKDRTIYVAPSVSQFDESSSSSKYHY